MAELAVRTHELTHLFGDRRALDAVDLEIRPGEMFGLLGPNGGGKSTLFRILSTLLRPTGGEASVFGHDVVRDPAAVRASIGVVFQSASLDRKLTVAENLRHQGHLYGLRGATLTARIDELLARFGLRERARDSAGALSGGLQRRVEIAKGMIHRPRLMLLDEPSTGLDPGARLDLWRQLCDIRDGDGTTCFLTTHILDEADGCDRIAILEAGKRIALGSPRDLKAEIAGDVVTIEADDPGALAAEIGDSLDVQPQVVGGALRFAAPNGFALDLPPRCRDRITSLTIGRPSLEDVFLERTGHVFRDVAADRD